MSPVVAVSLAVMAAADVVTILLLAAVAIAGMRLLRHGRKILNGFDPDIQPIKNDVRALAHDFRTIADVARDGAEHARTSAEQLGQAAGNVRSLIVPPTVPRWGLLAGAKVGARAVRSWHARRRAA